MLNEQNALALVLDGNVGMDRIPDLMRTMWTETALSIVCFDRAYLVV